MPSREGTHNRPCPTLWMSEVFGGYLQDYGWGVTYRSRKDSRQLHQPMATPAQGTTHNAGSLKPTAQPCRQLNRLESELSRCLHCSKPLASSWLVSASSRQLLWSESFLQLDFLPYEGWRQGGGEWEGKSLSFYCLPWQKGAWWISSVSGTS